MVTAKPVAVPANPVAVPTKPGANPVAKPLTQPLTIKKEDFDAVPLKDYNSHIIFNKWYLNNKNTHMQEVDFYNYLKESEGKQNETDFYLTNGINFKLEEGWDGTNKAITKINKNFFQVNKFKNIYNIGHVKKIKSSILNPDGQKIVNDSTNITDNDKYPGSTFYIGISDLTNKEKNKTFPELKQFNIMGIYHIKGWDHKKGNIENTEEYKKLVTAYYIAVLKHFLFDNNEINRMHMSILHLCQIPGDKFNATKDTLTIIKNKIYGYLFDNRKELQGKLFKISFDSNEPTNKFSYDDYIEYKKYSDSEYIK